MEVSLPVLCMTSIDTMRQSLMLIFSPLSFSLSLDFILSLTLTFPVPVRMLSSLEVEDKVEAAMSLKKTSESGDRTSA